MQEINRRTEKVGQLTFFARTEREIDSTSKQKSSVFYLEILSKCENYWRARDQPLETYMK